jgi:sulfur transfer protein SufE
LTLHFGVKKAVDEFAYEKNSEVVAIKGREWYRQLGVAKELTPETLTPVWLSF